LKLVGTDARRASKRQSFANFQPQMQESYRLLPLSLPCLEEPECTLVASSWVLTPEVPPSASQFTVCSSMKYKPENQRN